MKKILAFLVVFLLVVVGDVQKSYAMDFKDVQKSHPFAQHMMYLFDEGIIQGFGENLFAPDESVTRGAAAIMIARALDLDTSNKKTGFKDVGESSVAAGSIQAVKLEGIVNGYSDGKFYPEREVNRAEMAILLARAFEMTEKGLPTFTDISWRMNSYPSIQKVIYYGVAEGYSDNKFRPEAKLTRGQFSAFLARAMNEELRLKVSNTLSENEAVTISTQLTVEFRKTLFKLRDDNNWGFSNPGTYEIAKPALMPLMSEAFISSKLKPFIETFYCDCDLVDIPMIQDDMLRFTVLNVTEKSFTVKGLYLPNTLKVTPINHFINFKLENGRWKIDNWSNSEVSEDLNLTRDELIKGYVIPSGVKLIGEQMSKIAGGIVYIIDMGEYYEFYGIGKRDGLIYISY